jgi:DNA-binding CsgD family transcriptional regulator
VIMATTVSLGFSYSHQDDHLSAGPLFEEVRVLAEGASNEEMLAWYWLGMAWADYAAGRQDACREASRRALAAAHDVGDLVTEVAAASFLASVDIDAGRPGLALERLSPVRERARTRGGSFTLPLLDETMARAAAVAGELERARADYELLIEQGAGAIANVQGRAHVGCAEVLRALGDWAGAEARARDALEVADRIRNKFLLAQAKLVLARLAVVRQQWRDGQRLHHEALSAIIEGVYHRELSCALEGLAEVSAGIGNHAEAARMLGAAARARRDLKLVAWKHQRDDSTALRARLHDVLGSQVFERTSREGEALSLEDAIAYVRRARGARKRISAGWESLTPTELEIARHAAAGLTNPEIADRMFISRGTVRTHLSHIFSKLGIKNRSELAAETARRVAAGSAEHPLPNI